MIKISKRRKKEKALTTLVIILFCFFLILILSSILVIMAGNTADFVGKYRNQVTAMYAAKAGTEESLYQLFENNSWSDGFNQKQLADSGATYTVTFDQFQTVYPYSTNNSLGASSIIGYGGRIVPPGAVYLISTGEYTNKTVREGVLLTLFSAFKNAGFGDEGITLENIVTIDSYDSSIGSYDSTHKNSEGDLRTNAAEEGKVILSGSVNVYGDIMVGPGGSPAVVQGTGYTGAIKVASSSFPLPSVEVPPGKYRGDKSIGHLSVLKPGVYGTVTVDGGTCVLRKGNYIIDNFNVINGGTVILKNWKSMTKIYITNSLNFSNGAYINTNEKPEKLSIFGADSATSFIMSNGVNAYITLYAPKATVTMNDYVDFYGAIAVNIINMSNNSNLHHDCSLKNILFEGGSMSLNIVSRWEEY
ncbi:MAG: hypothetical protein K8T10_02620 [Candidatus Eremiobacteraeota bacterium]|nr:hypothetical protein [Candidatus Eremiobacteraeota bacterium]